MCLNEFPWEHSDLFSRIEDSPLPMGCLTLNKCLLWFEYELLRLGTIWAYANIITGKQMTCFPYHSWSDAVHRPSSASLKIISLGHMWQMLQTV